jgi:hypothetical protein
VTGPEVTAATDCAVAARVLLDLGSSDLARRRAQAHQRSCPVCASLSEVADDLGGEGGDAALVFSRLASARPRAAVHSRWFLGAMSAGQTLLSVPWVFGFNPLGRVLGGAAGAHLARDGTLGVLIGVAGLITAWRPRYAYAMLGVCGAIVLMQIGGGIVDEHADTVGSHFEAVHLLALGIATFIAMIAFRRGRPDSGSPV